MSEINTRVVLKDYGLEIAVASKEPLRINWCDVKEIVAFKEDCITFDSICIGFRVSEQNDYTIVMEEWEGLKNLLVALDREFPHLRKDWFNEVAFTDKAEDWITIWGTPPTTKLK